MSDLTNTPSIERPFASVNPVLNSQLPLFSDSMIHHKSKLYSNRRIVYYKGTSLSPSYGVSQSRRVLTAGVFLSKFDQVRNCLADVLNLTISQREVILRLLRLYAYYGNVYPKESMITLNPGCSKATFWRTVKQLQSLGLISVVNRYLIRPHAQISNLYKFDRLLLIIARYLAEHGVAFYEKWLKPYLAMPGHQFWPMLIVRDADRVPVSQTILAGPFVP